MRFSKISWIGLALAALCVVALVAMNAYVLDFTHGCYNAFTILFV